MIWYGILQDQKKVLQGQEKIKQKINKKQQVKK